MSGAVHSSKAVIVHCPKCGAKNRVDASRAGSAQPVCGRCGTKLTMTGAAGGAPVIVSDRDFVQVLSAAGEKPVLVDCWAPWCGPCRMLAPTLEALAAEAGGRYVIAKLNTDENPQAASRFDISSIPTMLIFKRGQLVDRLIGLQPKNAIATRLAAHA